jgi:hypothetical protein
MPNIQIGSFGRPGIFVKEYNDSQIDTLTVQGNQNLVVGFAKKGPFNTPVVINSLSDLESIYGPIDRRLERKGSFFHRTIAKLLESDPVVAINLLITDTSDVQEFKSFSTSSMHLNHSNTDGTPTEAPYDSYFDRAGFWTKDTEAFNTYVNSNTTSATERVLNFTNMGEKPITTFVFKSSVTGYDVDMVEWYGNPEDIPTFVYASDYVSDYMVDVVVLAGDWTDHQALAIDSRWSTYFNADGLIKSQVTDFINDPANKVLSYYQGLSLIPYFRNENGTNIFVENVVNADTDKTGLFCAYDIDKVQDTDYPTGLLDIVGNNIIGSDISEIEFLSYKDTITENIVFSDKLLDSAGNVASFGAIYKAGTPAVPTLNRSAFNAEGYVYGVTNTSVAFVAPVAAGTVPTYDITYDVIDGAYCIIGGQKIELNTTGATVTNTFTLDAANYIDDASVAGATVFTSVVVIDNTGEVKIVNNLVNNTNPTVSATDIVLGFVTIDIDSDFDADFTQNGVNDITAIVLTDITVDVAGFVELAPTVTEALGSVTIEFTNSATSNIIDYAEYREVKMFNNILTNLSGSGLAQMTMLIDSNVKSSMASMTLTDIITSSTLNKKLTIVTGLATGNFTDLTAGSAFCMYISDDEFILGTTTLVTKDTATTATEGIVATYSTMYESFRDGGINTGDYSYTNFNDAGDTYTVVFFDDGYGQDYISIVPDAASNISFTTNAQIIVPASSLNTGTFTITDPNPYAVTTIDSVSYTLCYKLSENVVSETLTTVADLWDVSDKVYLKMYLDSSSILNVTFVDSTLTAANLLDTLKNANLGIVTQKTNYQQTVEIEIPTGYTEVSNTILINADRYTEVKVGDYLAADNTSQTLGVGEIPKKITRILSKKLYAADTTLIEVTCDAAILKTDYSGDFQTLRFTNIDDYTTTYNGFLLSGFTVNETTSVPDGTETRQSAILDLLGSSTNMFKALTNKNTIQFRYLVDSFGNGLTENSKQQLVDICGERLDCFGFINAPSMKAFKQSTSPTFLDGEGVLSTSFIKDGGDPESNPAFLYSLASGTGTSSVGYFAPYVTVNDNGRPLSFPPAAFACLAYLRKFNTTRTNVKPWTVVAGVSEGRITGIAGLEMDFTNDDIVNFNLAKINPFVTKRNRGFVIETENTAETLVKSALSFIHVREVLIELEQELADMLLNFQWKFNTKEVRGEIKLRADLICEKYVNQGGLYSFFNKIDEENNTAELIDNQIGVLDTYIEPIKALSIIVNNITILNTGGIASNGFQ